MPGVDRELVDCGLPADGLEPDTPEPGVRERVSGEPRIKARDRRGLMPGAATAAPIRRTAPAASRHPPSSRRGWHAGASANAVGECDDRLAW